MRWSRRVIGIGNEYRSDDGVGLVVARELRARNLEQAQIMECSGDAAVLLEAWEGADMVILIDAIVSGAQPGKIHCFDLAMQMMPMDVAFWSTHGPGLSEAIGLARALGQLPPRVVVYGIEGKNFKAGVGLAPEMRCAVREVVEQVERRLKHM